jgi:predicted kinase
VPAAPLLVLSGPPGAGKSTVARLVAARFDRAVCLESDWFWTTVVRGFVPPWREEAEAQNHVVVRSYAAAASVMAAGGYAVVLDALVGPWLLDEVEAQARPLGVEVRYVVLRPSRQVALARATARGTGERVTGHPPLTDPGPVLRMWDAFADLGPSEDRVIDTTDLDPEETADAVWRLAFGDPSGG